VLVVAGIVWIVIAVSLFGLAVAAFVERSRVVRRERGDPAPRPPA
jgi:hypothetical protein